MIRLVVGLLCILLAACTIGPTYVRPKTSLPSQLVENSSSHFAVKNFKNPWWHIYQSKTLNQLIAESFKQHPTVKAAKAAIHNAKEKVLAQQGYYYPTVNLSIAPERVQTARILTSVLSNDRYDYGLFTDQLYALYSPDIFGANRRQEEMLIAEQTLRKLQLKATYLTLATSVTQTVIQISLLKEQIKMTEQMIQDQIKISNLLQKRRNVGDASSSMIHEQEQLSAQFNLNLNNLHRNLQTQQHTLNTLTGHFSQEKSISIPEFETLHLPKKIPITLPSSLLNERPDIRAAEEQMKSANAMVGLAMTNRLPHLELGTTNLGSASTNLMNLFKQRSIFWAISGIVTQPIYNAGTFKHLQRAAEAYYQQSIHLYRTTVLNAFQDTHDILTTIEQDKAAYINGSKAFQASQKSLEIAKKQILLGDLSFFDFVLIQQRHYQVTMNNMSQRAFLLMDVAALYQALGHLQKIKNMP